MPDQAEPRTLWSSGGQLLTIRGVGFSSARVYHLGLSPYNATNGTNGPAGPATGGSSGLFAMVDATTLTFLVPAWTGPVPLAGGAQIMVTEDGVEVPPAPGHEAPAAALLTVWPGLESVGPLAGGGGGGTRIEWVGFGLASLNLTCRFTLSHTNDTLTAEASVESWEPGRAVCIAPALPVNFTARLMQLHLFSELLGKIR